MIANIHLAKRDPLLEQASLFAEQPRQAATNKARFAQYFTSPGLAQFMCGFYSETNVPAHLLDPGAGTGALSAAFLERFKNTARISSVECDPNFLNALKISHSLSPVLHDVYMGDFIAIATKWLSEGKRPFSHVIMNPPYKKISPSTETRLHLRSVGLETTNLYSAFVALALLLLEHGGELVAIIPRSFCNGPYFRSFRKLLIENSALRSIHLFKSRTSLFSADKVLQENVILHLERDGRQREVKISYSTDDSFTDMSVAFHKFSSIVKAESSERFFRIPSANSSSTSSGIGSASLDLDVSTGPVIDFRMKKYLSWTPAASDVPLLYPGHFHKGLTWPRPNFKKPNSIALCAQTLKCLFPKGWYVVIKRFSSKEERRRIVAHIVNPDLFPAYEWLAFENHLNIFHKSRKGLSENIARGLAAYLNSMEVDKIFREISGHTQVNATDLRHLKYPDYAQLELIGKNSLKMTQEEIDRWLKIVLS